jgi:tRNA-dihydrouridine synthase B
MAESGVPAVMIGRAVLGRPWVFGHGREPGQKLKSELMYEHWHLQQKEYSPRDAVIKFRKHLLWYSRGHHNACEIRRSVAAIKLPSEVDTLLADLSGDK